MLFAFRDSEPMLWLTRLGVELYIILHFSMSWCPDGNVANVPTSLKRTGARGLEPEIIGRRRPGGDEAYDHAPRG